MYKSSDQIAAEALIGKTIRQVLIGPGEYELVFKTDTDPVIWLTDGDCCSTTWFADILGYDALKDGTVSNCECIVDESLPPRVFDESRTRQDCDQFYGYKITTNKGICDIIYRNSSNGYYGGNSYLGKELSSDLTEITGDWSA